MSKPDKSPVKSGKILFTRFHPGQGRYGTVTVKGITERNYNDNRVFFVNGVQAVGLWTN